VTRKRTTLAVAGAALALSWWRFRPFRAAVVGESMSPTFEAGDWLIAVAPSLRQLQRGVVVVVEHPERPGFELVKRLTAVPGDRMGALTLGPGQFWILGDRAEASSDSRWFGPVETSGIRGVVLFRYWPPARLGRVRPGPPVREADQA
jgi:nickel-type superoxide dismutase maturation protease